MKLPYVREIKIRGEFADLIEKFSSEPYLFFLDSSFRSHPEGRYSIFGIRPVKVFSSTGGMIWEDGRRYIDSPKSALKKLESTIRSVESDPYLPFSGGLVGFIGHSWPEGNREKYLLPDVWFGLYDTVFIYDHLENSCLLSSLGIDESGRPNIETAIAKCDEIEERLARKTFKDTSSRFSLYPSQFSQEPASSFEEGAYIAALEYARQKMANKVWSNVTIAKHFHFPTMRSGWEIHKLLRAKNPTPYSSFLRCGDFEISSISSNCVMNLEGTRFTYNVVLKSIQKDADKIMDNLVLKESLKNAQGNKMLADEIEPIRRLLDDVKTGDLELRHDMRSHYIVNKIEARAQKGMPVSELLSALMPPATMTGTPKFEVNNWLKRVEPESRYAYTGVIGYINGDGRTKFSQAVRIMMLKQNIAHVYAGSNIEPDLDPEREYTRTSQLVLSLSREINTHSQA